MSNWLIGSGGVSTMPRKKASTIAKRRQRRIESEEMMPSHPNTKRSNGIWNTSPNARTSLRITGTYVSICIAGILIPSHLLSA